VIFRSPTSDKSDERLLGLREDDLAACRPAGTVHRLDVSCTPLRTALAGPSTHAFDLADTIELARALKRLAAHVEVYGVEGSCFAAGARLSAAARRGAATVVAELVERFGPRPVKPRAGRRPAKRDPPSGESVGRAARPASASSALPSEDECGAGRDVANYWRL
jgi:hypothetical protein